MPMTGCKPCQDRYLLALKNEECDCLDAIDSLMKLKQNPATNVAIHHIDLAIFALDRRVKTIEERIHATSGSSQ